MDKSESFENLYHKRSAKFSFGRARDDSFPDNADNLLNCRYRFFTRISYTSGIQDVPFAYVDWIILQNVVCNSASLTVGQISEVEWTTGPKQRPNQWSKPPYLPLERLVSSRYGIGLDPESITDPERVGEYQPGNSMDLGDDVFTNFKTTQPVSTVNMENCDNTSTDSNDEVAEDLVENCSLSANIIQFLKMNEKQRK